MMTPTKTRLKLFVSIVGQMIDTSSPEPIRIRIVVLDSFYTPIVDHLPELGPYSEANTFFT